MSHESPKHYNDVIMGTIAYLITSFTIVYSTAYSDADQRKHQSSASLAFVRGIHRGPLNSPHKWPVTQKMFPFDDVIMIFLHNHKNQAQQNRVICISGMQRMKYMCRLPKGNTSDTYINTVHLGLLVFATLYVNSSVPVVAYMRHKKQPSFH